MVARKILCFAGVLAATFTLSICAYAKTHAGAKPEIYAPGTISSTVGVDCLSFTPDGNTAVFDQEPWSNIMIMVSHRVNDHWTTPEIAPFSGRWKDHDPVMAPDGSYLIFTSNRPDVPGDKPLHGDHLWRVDRKSGGWGKPKLLPKAVNFGLHIYAPSIAANGDLYFQSTDNPSHQFHLYRSTWENGHYQKAVQLHLGSPDARELDPAIAPDESFIVFDANYADKNKPDHLYIAFREGNHWSKPLDLGEAIDRYQPWGSHLGPDGHTLYFTSNATIKASYPRTREQARKDLARIRSWNNGVNHIWRVDLTPWLQAHRVKTVH